MDITNKAVKVSERMQEIEYRLACKDMTVRDADDLRYEYAELEDWNHLLNAYFKLRAENEALKGENEALKSDLHSVMEKVLIEVRKMAHANSELTTGQKSQAAKEE